MSTLSPVFTDTFSPRHTAVAGVVGMLVLAVIGGLGAQAAMNPPFRYAEACVPRYGATSEQIDAASARLRLADRLERQSALNGSSYATAKLGLDLSDAERTTARAAAVELIEARAMLAALCH